MRIVPFSLLRRISRMRNQPQMQKWPKKVDGKYPRYSVDKAISQLNVNDFMIAKTPEDRIIFLNTMRSFYGKGCAKTFWVKSKKHFKCIRKK